jgi:hypothetical protein
MRPLCLSCLAAVALGVLSCSSGAPANAPPPAPAPVSPAAASTCPPTLTASQTLSGGVAGWEPFEDDSPIQLMSVGVFDGHPREQASLVPDADTAAAGRRVAVWDLPDNGTRQYWLACYYDHSRIALTRMLAGDVKRVEVARDPQTTIGGLPAVTDITVK